MAMPNVFTYDAQLVEGRLQYSCQIHQKGYHRMKVHSLHDQNQPLYECDLPFHKPVFCNPINSNFMITFCPPKQNIYLYL